VLCVVGVVLVVSGGRRSVQGGRDVLLVMVVVWCCVGGGGGCARAHTLCVVGRSVLVPLESNGWLVECVALHVNPDCVVPQFHRSCFPADEYPTPLSQWFLRSALCRQVCFCRGRQSAGSAFNGNTHAMIRNHLPHCTHVDLLHEAN
jgi:hypothetical protein